MEEYVNQPFVQNNGQFKQIADVCINKIEGQYTGFSHQKAKSKSGKTNIIYFNARGTHNNHET